MSSLSVLRHKTALAFLLVLATTPYLTAQGTVEVTTLAGLARSSGSVDGLGAAARFQQPGDIATDLSGTVHVTDIVNGNYTVRKITPAGLVTTTSINANRFAIDSIGNLYVLSSTGVDKYTTTGQKIPINLGGVSLIDAALATDAVGNLYVSVGSTIYRVSPTGSITNYPNANAGANSFVVDGTGTVFIARRNAIFIYPPGGRADQLVGAEGNSGSSDGVGAAARFGEKLSLAIDAEGNLYVADTENSTIRKVSLVPFGTGFRPERVSTIAGQAGSTGSQDGNGSNARFFSPAALTVDQGSGLIYVSDSGNRTIRRIAAANPTIFFSHFAAGGGIAANISINNTSRSTPAACVISFSDDNGNPISAETLTGRSAGFTVPAALGKVTISTLESVPPVAGSVRVSCNVTTKGFIRFVLPGIGVAGTGASAPATQLLIPVVQTPTGLRSGIAIQNIEDAPLIVVLNLYDARGNHVSSIDNGIPITLPPRGHRSAFIGEIFRGLDSTFDGILSVSTSFSNGRMTAISFEVGFEAGQFTTVPVHVLQ